MKKIIKIAGEAFAALIAASLVAAAPLQAQDLGRQPIRMIVGVVAGGATDVTARIIAQKMSESLGIPVLVEDRPGAFFEAAYRAVTRAAPDGHTLFMISASTTVAQPARKNFPYDIRKLAPISEVSKGPFILISRKGLHFKTVNDLIAYGKVNPGKLSFGSGGGAGSSLSLATQLLRLRAGIQIVDVPYKGAAEALTDVLGEHIDAMFDALPVEVPQVKAGAVSGLAVTSAQRSPALPQVPTMIESGLKGFEAYNYFGLLATPGTPRPIIDKLHDAVVKAVASPDVVSEFEKQGMAPASGTPEEFAKMLAEDLERWTKVMKDAGIQPQ
jgi:tripartite-type tricarboxylate transporter receptor subunit TctC